MGGGEGETSRRVKAVIIGIAGPELAPAEAALFRAEPPAGVILFARNIRDPLQLASLITNLRQVLPRDAVLMVDQEGGRVARLRPPYWRAHPPASAFGKLFEADPRAGLRAAWLTGALIGLDCQSAGFDAAAAPVLDVPVPGADAVIGDRALATEPQAVGRLGRALAAGLLAAGIQPVGKHAPGHGRARVDSHFALPVVDANDLRPDLLPFACNSDLPWLMTAHIVYPVWDAKRPATLSAEVIGAIIRGKLGFGGVLVTDDLAMKALAGEPADVARQALQAGCDLALYCAGDHAANEALLRTCPPVSGAAWARLRVARAVAAGRRLWLDAAGLEAERARLLA
jgi:beta-N-acetylhexosaminidase